MKRAILAWSSAFPYFLSAVVIAGAMQIVLGVCARWNCGLLFPECRYQRACSVPLGLMIILKQIPHALGHDVISEGFDGFWQQDGENTFTELWVALGDINPAAVSSYHGHIPRYSDLMGASVYEALQNLRNHTRTLWSSWPWASSPFNFLPGVI